MTNAEWLLKMACVKGQMLRNVGESGGWITGATEIHRERQDALLAGAAALDRQQRDLEAIKAADSALRDSLDEVTVLLALVGELAEERDMWRIRCESPDATPVCVFEGEG